MSQSGSLLLDQSWTRQIQEGGSQWVPISKEELLRALFLYSADHVYLKEARYAEGCLQGTFRHFPYFFSKREVRHFTREQAVLFLTQTSYVLGYQLLKDGLLAPIDEALLAEMAETEQILFSRIGLSFKTLIQNKDGIRIEMRCDNIKRTRHAIILNMSFSFEDEGCVGECEAYLRLSHGLRVVVPDRKPM